MVGLRPVPFSLESWKAEPGILMKTRLWSYDTDERQNLKPHSLEAGTENQVKSSAASSGKSDWVQPQAGVGSM